MSAGALAAWLAAATGASFALSLILTLAARRIATKVGYVDHPGGHKSHASVTPYGGGTAIILAAGALSLALLAAALLIPSAWILDNFGETMQAYVGGAHTRAGRLLIVLAGALAIHLLGLYDDLRPQGPTVKLIVMAAVGLLVATVGQVRIAEFLPAPVSVALTVVWIIMITNTFNFLDNMDGLSAGVAAICTLILVVCGVLAGQVLVPALGAVLLGAIGGFLVFNFPPARIFMGDAGSLPLGYMLAVLAVMTSYYDSGAGLPPFAIAMPLVVLAVPLYDFVSVVTIRLREGRNPMQGDQRHFSHRLVDRGLSKRFAVLTIYLATAATGLGATLLPGAGVRQAITILAMVVLVLLIVAILEMPRRDDA